MCVASTLVFNDASFLSALVELKKPQSCVGTILAELKLLSTIYGATTDVTLKNSRYPEFFNLTLCLAS